VAELAGTDSSMNASVSYVRSSHSFSRDAVGNLDDILCLQLRTERSVEPRKLCQDMEYQGNACYRFVFPCVIQQ
jgi:hypothetical protein